MEIQEERIELRGRLDAISEAVDKHYVELPTDISDEDFHTELLVMMMASGKTKE